MRLNFTTRWMRHAVVTLAMTLALPAFADIAAFNAAIGKGDYKAAADAAASTWPQLDKARPDLDAIGREFGFAAYMAGDFAAAQTYAQAAVDHPGKAALPDTSMMLLRMSQHRATPSSQTRDQLADALAARVNRAEFDYISFRGADALVSYDIQQGLWDKTAPDDALAIKLVDAGGPGMTPARRTFELYAAIASYMQKMTPEKYAPFVALRDKVIADIGAAPNDAAAKAYASVYWSNAAWEETLRNHQAARGHRFAKPEHGAADKAAQARLDPGAGEMDTQPGCEREMLERTKPDYPRSALYNGFVGTVMVRMDVDAEGYVSNPQLLASVPEASFGEAVLKAAPRMHFAPVKNWDKSRCSMAVSHQIISFPFIIRR